MKEQRLPYHFTVTATTRPRRATEQEGVDYFFLPQETFDRMAAQGAFLEQARVYGYSYGVPRAQVVGALKAGRDVIIKADVQGAATLKRLAPQGVFIFLVPPSLEELEVRLRGRGGDPPEDLQLRLRTAQAEMERLPLFDYLVVNHNGRLDEAASAVDAIIRAEKCRIPPREVSL
jgi:guanylate kinase